MWAILSEMRNLDRRFTNVRLVIDEKRYFHTNESKKYFFTKFLIRFRISKIKARFFNNLTHKNATFRKVYVFKITSRMRLMIREFSNIFTINFYKFKCHMLYVWIEFAADIWHVGKWQIISPFRELQVHPLDMYVYGIKYLYGINCMKCKKPLVKLIKNYYILSD